MSREIMQQALDALKNGKNVRQGMGNIKLQIAFENDAIAALEAELAEPEQELVTNSDLYSISGRLALELECLLLDTKDISIASKWWDSAHEALDQWRKFHFRACAALDKKADNARALGLEYKQNHGFDRTASHMAGEYMSTKQQNVSTSEERVHKMCICEHIQRCNTFDKCMKGC